MSKIGHFLAAARIKQGLQQQDIAEQLKLSVSYLSQVERNAKMPSLKLLHRICLAYKTTIPDILFDVVTTKTGGPTQEERQIFEASRELIDAMVKVLLKSTGNWEAA